jgi:predicted permease
MREPLLVRIFRRLLGWLPLDLRPHTRDDAVRDLASLIAIEHERTGTLGALRLWGRAVIDACIAAVRSVADRLRRWLPGWRSDLRLAFRALRRAPLFSAVVIATIALSVGSIAAVLTLADPMLFRPLPYSDGDRVVRIIVSNGRPGAGAATAADYVGAMRASTLASVGTFDGPVITRLPGAPVADKSFIGYNVTDGFFDMLGTRPMLGRLFEPDEYARAVSLAEPAPHAPIQPILITDDLWLRAFGGAPDIVGRVVPVEVFDFTTTSVRVVGVLPHDFVLPDLLNERPLFLAPSRGIAAASNPNARAILFARVRHDTSLDAAQAEMQAIVAANDRASASGTSRTVTLRPIRDVLFHAVRPKILLLLGTCVCVLVLAIANLVHLSLARATDRARELSVRRAIGAGRLAIARLLLTESFLLAALGACASLGAGKILFSIAMAVAPRLGQLGHVYRLMPASLDGRIVAATIGVTALAFVIFGVAPAWLSARRDDHRTIAGAGTRVRRGWTSADRLLTSIQAGVAVSVLVTAVLLASSFVKLQASTRGVDYSGVHYARVTLPREYFSPEGVPRAYALSRDVLRRVEQQTGVRLGMTSDLPGVTLPFALRRAEDASDSKTQAFAYPATRTFLDTVRVQLVQGRLYSDEEAFADAPVAVIDERAAATLWPDGRVLGRPVVTLQGATPHPRTVVGVVRTIAFANQDSDGTAFVPFEVSGRLDAIFVWRGVPPDVPLAVRAATTAIEPRARVEVGDVSESFEWTMGEPRFLSRVLVTLAAVALALTMAGIFATVSHRVSGRTAEIGVRLALGATRPGVVRLIVREALLPTVIGAIIGAVACLAWTRTLRGVLFEIAPTDPRALLLAIVLVLLVSTLASLVPGRRASRVDPAVALRAE